MIQVSVLYPYQEGATFDIDYYLNHHVPMVRDRLGAACKGAAVEQGIAGATPESSPTYIAMGHLLFGSMEVFQAAFAPHATEIMADIPNYTKIQPIIQISEVKMS